MGRYQSDYDNHLKEAMEEIKELLLLSGMDQENVKIITDFNGIYYDKTEVR